MFGREQLRNGIGTNAASASIRGKDSRSEKFLVQSNFNLADFFAWSAQGLLGASKNKSRCAVWIPLAPEALLTN